MKRIVLWLLSTLSVLVLLFGYHTSTSGVSSAASPPAVISGSTSSTSTTGGSSGASGSSSGSSGSSGSGSSGSGSSGSGSSGSSKSSGSGATKPAAKPATTVTGDVAQTQWGPVQVELTVKSGTITQVSVLQYPSGNSTDAQINNYALPILIQETTDRQSAGIDMVGGATVTSTGYIQSLQSAIDQAGL